MKIIIGKRGGLVANIGNRQFCVFPANRAFAKSPSVLVVFGVGFSWAPLS